MNDNSFLKAIGIFAYLFVIIGALNWGLIGVLKFDIVEFLFGEMTKMTRIIYFCFGISAIVSVIATSMCSMEKE